MRIFENGIHIKKISADDSNKVRERLAEVNRILRRRTCVRLNEMSEEGARRLTDYLVLDTGRDYVTGRVGGKQVTVTSKHATLASDCGFARILNSIDVIHLGFLRFLDDS